MKKTFLSTVAGLALAVAMFAAPAKADVIVIDLAVVGQEGIVGGQLNGSFSGAVSSAGKAVAEATSAAIVNNFSNDSTMAVTTDCGCSTVIAGVGTILGQSGAVGLQGNLAAAGASGKTGANAAANAIGIVNNATKTTSIAVKVSSN